jgi:hypothetical protein
MQIGNAAHSEICPVDASTNATTNAAHVNANSIIKRHEIVALNGATMSFSSRNCAFRISVEFGSMASVFITKTYIYSMRRPEMAREMTNC